jgi:hypothetical protein
MDCPRSLSILLPLVLSGLIGCTPNQLLGPIMGDKPATTEAAQAASVPAPSPVTEPIAKEAVKELTPKTLVAMAAFHEQLANELARDPAEKQRVMEEARVAYEKAVSVDPKYLPGHLGLARHWEMRDRHDLAVHFYDECLKLAPKDAGLFYEAGMCQAKHKEWEAALARLSKAVELDPENRACAMNFALCLARSERFDESLAWLRKLQPEAEAQFTLARMMHHLGRYDLCMEHVRQSLNADPMFIPAQQLLSDLTAPAPPTPVAAAPAGSMDVAAPFAAPAPPAPVVSAPPAPMNFVDMAPPSVAPQAPPTPPASPAPSVAPAPTPPAEPPPPDANLVHPSDAETPAPTAPEAPAANAAAPAQPME